jgi:hypothetical protein
MPRFDHVYLLVMENQEYDSIVGNPDAPYVSDLIASYGLATNYYAITHPSQPNYLALFTGGTRGVRDNAVHHVGGRNLVDQLSDHRLTWRVHAQDYPGRCSQVEVAQGGVDLDGAPGTYVRKHNPAIGLTSVSSRPGRCAHVTNLDGFNAAGARFQMIIPNMINSMHDGTVRQGDDFLRAFVPRITQSAAFGNSLLLITWDEGSSGAGGGGRVAAIVVSPRVPAGFRSATRHDHFSLLRTIEGALGLGCLRHACEANDLREFFL